MKTILVPTDFSKSADNALQYALAVAKKEKARIIVLNVFDFIYINPDMPMQYVAETLEVMEQTSDKKLRLLGKQLSKTNVRYECLNYQGSVTDTILNVSSKKKADLIIMGTKGASGVKEVLMGSNTAKVIEKSRRPVIAVPDGISFGGIRKIMYASDYHASDIDALKSLVDVAKLFNAHIVVLHASDEEFNRYSEETYLNEFKKKVEKKIKYKKISYKLELGKELEKTLHKEVAAVNPDLIAMSTQRRNLIERLFGSSVTKRMAYHSRVPLIAFHHKKESVVFI